ncbi:hypothetical protein BDW68DRAFT_127572 [Aspergillus falconensis]
MLRCLVCVRQLKPRRYNNRDILHPRSSINSTFPLLLILCFVSSPPLRRLLCLDLPALILTFSHIAYICWQ